ncbi:MAG TPA: ester cyclase, partial [Chloroflexota bacterium]
EENKAVVRRWFAAIDRGDEATAIDELLAEDYVDHTPPIPGLPPGRAGVKRANELLSAAFADTVHTIEEQLAEGDKVMTRVVTRGTFVGPFLGYAPTGRTIEITGVAVHRVAGGKLVEHWAHADMASFMQQIGGSHQPREAASPPR